MRSNRINVGIVGLGRWAKVLARAARHSDLVTITAGYSRSEDKRSAFAGEFNVASMPDLATMLADPAIGGVIITVPNEQHLAVARELSRHSAEAMAVSDDLVARHYGRGGEPLEAIRLWRRAAGQAIKQGESISENPRGERAEQKIFQRGFVRAAVAAEKSAPKLP